MGDEVLHIELTRWADCLVVAPLSANYLAKVANGLCDDLLTSIIRAWPPDKPVLLCPAMHELMWRSPHTTLQLGALQAHENYHLSLFGSLRKAALPISTLDSAAPNYEVGSVVAAIASLERLELK